VYEHFFILKGKHSRLLFVYFIFVPRKNCQKFYHSCFFRAAAGDALKACFGRIEVTLLMKKNVFPQISMYNAGSLAQKLNLSRSADISIYKN